ncbi:MAG: 50S ribosomal protein L32e [Candidatus Nanoarchaeia archaeon]|nr:50S ribosomal protein L32e [Candidatus Nanoarchaeia archaeon]
MKEQLALRREMKSRKPEFLRQDVRKKISLEDKWRVPKGSQSKLRRKYKGTRPFPSQGYRSPAKVRGLTREGFKPLVINTILGLKKLDQKAALISSSVGARKKIQILEEAKKLGIKILNIKDSESFIKNKKESIEKRKTEAKARKDKKLVEAKKKEVKKEEKKEHTHEEKKKQETEAKKKIIEGK